MKASCGEALAPIIGMAVVKVIVRGFFLFPREEWKVRGWLRQGLEVAPLAALVAVLAPEVFMTDGELIETWPDARLPAVAAATLWYAWRPGILGPLVAGIAFYLPARLLLGW